MKFSEYFKLGRTQPYLDFIDIRLDTDIPVFLDPTAIRSLQSTFGKELISLLQSFFDTVLRYIHADQHESAKLLLSTLNECNEFHLGYSKGLSRGRAFGQKSATHVWSALSESGGAITGLLKDIEDTCLLIDGIGSDMISDALCNILRGPLIKYTHEMCHYYGIGMCEQVDSGPIWNAVKECWEHSFVQLPIAKGYGKIILVPKVLVRHRFTYKYDDYYRHFVLPEMQIEELRANSTLVRVLKDGREIVTKKDLMEKYGADKLAVRTETLKRPNALDEYRVDKRKKIPLPLTHEELSEVIGDDGPDWDTLINELKNISLGREAAYQYEDIVEKILTALFYPSLCFPTKQENLHDGRKRVDLTYINEATNGFFYWIAQHYSAAQIFIECKNYNDKVGNPEIDQLSGRFSPSRGQFGLLVYRGVVDKKKLMQRCKDTARDTRGYIVPLDDVDLITLMRNKKEFSESNEYPFLREQFKALIN